MTQERENLQNETVQQSLMEIVQQFQQMLERGDQQEMYKNADSIKAAFYKTLRREKVASAQHSSSIESEQSDTRESDDQEQLSENPFAEIERGFKELYQRYRVERAAFQQQLEREREQNLDEKNRIIEELKELVETQEDLKHTFPAFRELQNRWRVTGPVPQSYNKTLWENYQFLVEKFYDYVKINNELRDLDFKKNLESKTELSVRAEKLIEEKNVVEAFKALQKLHEEWREIGPVSKELREEVWERFKSATSTINKRQQDYFEGLKESHKRNLELKTELCEKAEELLSNSGEEKEWNRLSKEMEKIQSQWRKIGFASKRENQKIWERFRAACDKFYDNKREHYASFKLEMEENLKLKIALCEESELLMNSEEWKATTDKLIALQKRWKEIGPVARKESDQVWKRFRAACDHFFERKSAHFSSIEKSYESNLKLKRALIEEIRNYQSTNNREEDGEALQSFKERWEEIGFVPFKEKERIFTSYRESVQKSFPQFKMAAEEQKLSGFKRHIKEVQNSPRGERGVKFERDRLFQKFRTIEQEIALLENNMGFFAKSKKADNIIKEMEKKIVKYREEMEQLEKKIKLIDKQYE